MTVDVGKLKDTTSKQKPDAAAFEVTEDCVAVALDGEVKEASSPKQ